MAKPKRLRLIDELVTASQDTKTYSLDKRCLILRFLGGRYAYMASRLEADQVKRSQPGLFEATNETGSKGS